MKRGCSESVQARSLSASAKRWRSAFNGIPRLLNVVITGFDNFLRDTSPGFRRPGTVLLSMSVRIPVLAGVARVVRRPSHWTERILPAVADSARPALAG